MSLYRLTAVITVLVAFCFCGAILDGCDQFVASQSKWTSLGNGRYRFSSDHPTGEDWPKEFEQFLKAHPDLVVLSAVGREQSAHGFYYSYYLFTQEKSVAQEKQ